MVLSSPESSSEMVDIVDANDVVITTKPRSERNKDDIVRTSALWLVDKDGKILLAKRHSRKKQSGGKWSIAVAETVQADESYLDALIRGAYEEIGLRLRNNDLYEADKVLSTYDEYPSFKQRYYAICSDEVKFHLSPDPTEVEEIRWFSPEEIAELLKSPHLVSRSLADVYGGRMTCRDQVITDLLKNLG